MAAEFHRSTLNGDPVDEDRDWLCQVCGLYFDPQETPDHLRQCKFVKNFHTCYKEHCCVLNYVVVVCR